MYSPDFWTLCAITKCMLKIKTYGCGWVSFAGIPIK